ncbi:hypothetical protein B566_EDAN004464 [Ephemera danica]|nr:hypothetical protein B566_EDAN004464 [Ephemera danica]
MRHSTGVSTTTTVAAPRPPDVIMDPMAITWTAKYSDSIEKYWSKLPSFLASCIATLAIFIFGASMNVHVLRQFGYGSPSSNATGLFQTDSLEGFPTFWIWSAAVSYIMYFGIGGFLHWYFYTQRRDTAHEWKCQPNSWMPPDLEKHEIALGSLTLMFGCTLSAMVSCHIYNGGWSMVYYNFSDYPWYWNILQWVAIFVYQDYLTYWFHRIYHTPFLYKNFHKLHHKYKQPTAFSVTAIHPIESLMPYSVIAIYTYYHGIIDHSGINFKAYWWQPWQPDAIFHDNHHQYFHIHGTYRKKDRLYREDLYYGQGKAITEASAEELAADIRERQSENPRAYRSDKLEFALTEHDLKKKN